jgi:hypothetical protein
VKQFGGEDAARTMLFAKDLHESDLLIRFLETGKEVILLQLLVIVLDEGADDRRAFREQAWFEIRLRSRKTADAFLVDEKNPVEDSVLPHQVLRRSDLALFALLLLSGSRPGARHQENCAGETKPAKKLAPIHFIACVHRATSGNLKTGTDLFSLSTLN